MRLLIGLAGAIPTCVSGDGLEINSFGRVEVARVIFYGRNGQKVQIPIHKTVTDTSPLQWKPLHVLPACIKSAYVDTQPASLNSKTPLRLEVTVGLTGSETDLTAAQKSAQD